MATVKRQAWRIARKDHHCHFCGYIIFTGSEYQDLTFIEWGRLIFAKVGQCCIKYTLHPDSDCEYVVEREPAKPWGEPLSTGAAQ
jgi:hypothetical protein